MLKSEFSINNTEDLPQVAKWLFEHAQGESIWLFEGEMGAGKTTLITSLCKELNVEDSISSPTFSIVNEYATVDNKTVYHFDFYRIENQMEAMDIGVYEYFDSGHLCLIEWASQIPDLLPERCFVIKINVSEDLGRNYTCYHYGID